MALGKDPRDIKKTRAIIININLRAIYSIRIFRALMDSGAIENFILQRVIVEEGLVIRPLSTGAYSVNSHNIRIYG